MNENNLIYALVDPVSKHIRYIGKSTKGMIRPNQHRYSYSLIYNSYKNNWIKSLLSEGLMYEILILEQGLPAENLSDREQYWIKYHLEAGAPLTNLTVGGDGILGFKQREESKALMSLKRKEWFKNNKPTEAMLVRYKRRETKIENGNTYLTCSDCKLFVNIDDFYNNKCRYDGKDSICKKCALVRKEIYREETRKVLPKDAWDKSYSDRKEKMTQGVQDYFDNNPAAKENLSKKLSKPIIRYNPQTGETKEYSSALSAKKDGFNNSYISSAIKSNKLYKGFKWRFKSPAK